MLQFEFIVVLYFKSMAEENQNDPFSNPSRRSYVYETSKNSSNRSRIILIVVGIIILIALVAFAVIATGGKGEEIQVSPTPAVQTPTPSATETPTPEESPTSTPKVTPTGTKTTPEPTAASGTDRSNLKIKILNGSGTPGAASKASDALKKLGYDVVSTDNADNFDYEGVTIQVKSTKKTYLSQLKNDLSDDYTVSSATSDYTGTDADAVVIVGK